MKSLLYLFVIGCIFSSCSSNLSPIKSTQKIHIFSKENGSIVHNEDTIALNYYKKDLWIPQQYSKTIKVQKSKEPLHICFISNDSLEKEYVLISKSIKPNYEDPIPTESYSYPNRFKLLSQDTIVTKTGSFVRPKKGSVYLNVSVPFGNFYEFAPDNHHKISKGGFLGISLGIDYYHSPKQFLNLSYNSIIDFLAPIPAPVDYENVDAETFLWSNNFSLSNNHRLNRFTLGYGFSFATNHYNLPNADPAKHYAIGNVFSTYYQFSKSFHLGVIYRPTYYRPQLLDKFQYEHAISIDLMWKIRLK